MLEIDRRVRAQVEHPHVLAESRGKYSHTCRKEPMSDVVELSGFRPILGETGVPQNQSRSNVDENLKSKQSYGV